MEGIKEMDSMDTVISVGYRLVLTSKEKRNETES